MHIHSSLIPSSEFQVILQIHLWSSMFPQWEDLMSLFWLKKQGLFCHGFFFPVVVILWVNVPSLCAEILLLSSRCRSREFCYWSRMIEDSALFFSLYHLVWKLHFCAVWMPVQWNLLLIVENVLTAFPPELKGIVLLFHLSDKCLSSCVRTLFSVSVSFLSASRCP